VHMIRHDYPRVQSEEAEGTCGVMKGICYYTGDFLLAEPLRSRAGFVQVTIHPCEGFAQPRLRLVEGSGF